MTKSEMGYLDVGLMGPLLLFLNQYFNSFLPEYCVLWIAMIWCTLDLMRYCSQVYVLYLLTIFPSVLNCQEKHSDMELLTIG